MAKGGVTTASVSVSVRARTKQFDRAMMRARKKLVKFGNSVRRIAKRVARFGVALAAVATGAMVLFVRQAFKTLDALAKTADRMGIAADTLRSFERAAELSGSTIQVLRKGLVMMTKNVAEVATGVGEAKQALEDLGLDAKELVKLKPDEMFFRIVRALDQIPNRTRKIYLMTEVFGVRAVQLLNMIDLGEKKLREMVGESQRLMGSLSPGDLANIQWANDRIGDLVRSLRRGAEIMAIQLAPMVGHIAKQLTEWHISVRETFGPRTLGFVVGFISEVLHRFELLFAKLRLEILEIERALKDVWGTKWRRTADARIPLSVLGMGTDYLARKYLGLHLPGLRQYGEAVKPEGLSAGWWARRNELTDLIRRQEARIRKLETGNILSLGQRLFEWFNRMAGRAPVMPGPPTPQLPNLAAQATQRFTMAREFRPSLFAPGVFRGREQRVHDPQLQDALERGFENVVRTLSEDTVPRYGP